LLLLPPGPQQRGLRNRRGRPATRRGPGDTGQDHGAEGVGVKVRPAPPLFFFFRYWGLSSGLTP
jgi:hypothetical protein